MELVSLCCCQYFCSQATPNAGTAMFYFKTNKLGFKPEFFGRVKLVAAIADLLGAIDRLSHLAYVINKWHVRFSIISPHELLL